MMTISFLPWPSGANNLNLGIILLTDKELFRERIRSATAQVVIVTVLLFVIALVVSVATAFIIRRPIIETARFVEEASRLDIDASADTTKHISIFRELGDLHQASLHTANLLGMLKGYVPHGVLQQRSDLNASGDSTAASGTSTVLNPLAQMAEDANGEELHSITSPTTTGSFSAGSTNFEEGGGVGTDMTLNVDRVSNRKVNSFRSSVATIVVVQMFPKRPSQILKHSALNAASSWASPSQPSSRVAAL